MSIGHHVGTMEAPAVLGGTIEFTQGIPGFPEASRFSISRVDHYAMFVWFEAADSADVAFLAVNPFVYFPTYDVPLNDAEEAALEVEPGDELVVYCFVTIDGENRTATANLLAPIVVNVSKAIAAQVILEADLDLRTPLPVPPTGDRAE